MLASRWPNTTNAVGVTVCRDDSKVMSHKVARFQLNSPLTILKKT
jgi:hypothetical protein